MKFFVYGTLKQGHRNHDLLFGAESLGLGVTEGKYKLYDLGGFPAAVPSSEGQPVLGEVYQSENPAVVKAMDFLESNGSFYTRSEKQILLDSGLSLSCWVYELLGYENYDWGNRPLCKLDPDRLVYRW